MTTRGFLAQFGFESLRDLPDLERLQDAGLLGAAGEATLEQGSRIDSFPLDLTEGDEPQEDAA